MRTGTSRFSTCCAFRILRSRTLKPSHSMAPENERMRFVFRSNLGEIEMHLPEEGTLWYALHVRTRFEKVVARNLRGKGYEEFLPLYSRTNRWSDRVKEIELPLFPGYVFCRFNPHDRLPI